MIACLLLSVAMVTPAVHGGTNDFHQGVYQVYQTITWGEATNGIQLGLVRTRSPIAHGGDQLRMLVFIGIPASGSPKLGLLPVPRGHRLDLSLLDEHGDPVERTAIGDSKCRGISPGIIRGLQIQRKAVNLPAGTPYEYDKFNLLDCFRLSKPGTYRLIVRGNLFKLAAYPKIERLILPAASTSVSIEAQDLERARSRSHGGLIALYLAGLCCCAVGATWLAARLRRRRLLIKRLGYVGF